MFILALHTLHVHIHIGYSSTTYISGLRSISVESKSQTNNYIICHSHNCNYLWYIQYAKCILLSKPLDFTQVRDYNDHNNSAAIHTYLQPIYLSYIFKYYLKYYIFNLQPIYIYHYLFIIAYICIQADIPAIRQTIKKELKADTIIVPSKSSPLSNSSINKILSYRQKWALF